MKPLLVATLTLVGVVFLRPATVSTQACNGCKLEREVSARVFLTVDAWKPNECSEWIAQEMPDHQHQWATVGCVRTGGGVSMVPRPAVIQLSAHEWIEFLKQAEPEDRSRLVALACRGELAGTDLGHELEEWLANKRLQRTPLRGAAEPLSR